MARRKLRQLVDSIAKPYAKAYGSSTQTYRDKMKRKGSQLRKVVASRIKMERKFGNIRRGTTKYYTDF